MRRLFAESLSNWFARRYQRRVERALGLHLRGEARNDGLRLKRVNSRLEIEWRARDIHPWDRDRDAEDRADLFVKQALADADEALSRLFTLLPHIDSVELRVLEPKSDQTIMRGVVFRSSLTARRPLSNRIWLGRLGVQFRLTGNRFEPLELLRGENSRTG